LSGMRERAALVGGRITVRSARDAGTQVDFSAPGARAYSKASPVRSWLFPKSIAPGELGK
jgi:signal transduction histidine kinase